MTAAFAFSAKEALIIKEAFVRLNIFKPGVRRNALPQLGKFTRALERFPGALDRISAAKTQAELDIRDVTAVYRIAFNIGVGEERFQISGRLTPPELALLNMLVRQYDERLFPAYAAISENAKEENKPLGIIGKCFDELSDYKYFAMRG